MYAIRSYYDAFDFAKKGGYTTVIIDTAGRSQLDQALMDELRSIQSKVNVITSYSIHYTKLYESLAYHGQYLVFGLVEINIYHLFVW